MVLEGLSFTFHIVDEHLSWCLSLGMNSHILRKKAATATPGNVKTLRELILDLSRRYVKYQTWQAVACQSTVTLCLT